MKNATKHYYVDVPRRIVRIVQKASKKVTRGNVLLPIIIEERINCQ